MTGTAARAVALLRLVLPGAAELRHYRLSWLRPDLLAGLPVWGVLVPQGLVYGELAASPRSPGCTPRSVPCCRTPWWAAPDSCTSGRSPRVSIVTAA